MPIYEHKRAVLCTIPALAMDPTPTLAAILDDLEGQVGADAMRKLICNIMQHSNKAFLLHLAKPEQVPEFVAHGYTFRGHQLKIDPVRSSTIVVLDRVPYGLPKEAITAVLGKFGNIASMKQITHKGYGMSKWRLEIELRQDVPSRVNVQGNPINVFYKNQPRSCFVCREAGHEAKNCPRKGGPARIPPTDHHPQPSFAQIAARAKPPTASTASDASISGLPSTVETSNRGAPPTAESNSGASESLPDPPPPPPPPAPPVKPVPTSEMGQSKPASDPTVVPPVSEAQLPPAEDTNESSEMDTQPQPDIVDTTSSVPVDPRPFHLPTTQELFQKLASTPPVLRPRPDELSETSDSSQSVVQEGSKYRIQKKRGKGPKNLHDVPAYKSSADTIHESSRTRTTPSRPPTSGSKHH